MSEDKVLPEPQSLVNRFGDVWGEQAAMVYLLGSVIRICENAMFQDKLREDLEEIRDLANEGLEALDHRDSSPKQGFGFSMEGSDGA